MTDVLKMAAPIRLLLTCAILIYLLDCSSHAHQKLSKDDIMKYRDRASAMFYHAYEGYLNHAFPFDELRPLTCDGHDTWGSYSLTLVDALDTLAIMGNFTEFRRVAKLLVETLDFNRDINVSVFETNIRVVGGLLSAHLISRRAGMELNEGWPCSGPLLSLAEKVARKLLPAFDTLTGMPYGTVNLLHGVPKGETTITCTAGVGTFIIEFGTLSRLTGDPVFEEKAMRAMHAMYESRSSINLIGNHINIESGKWTALDAGIGAGVDSYFEYLVKGSILFHKADLRLMFNEHVAAIEQYLKREDWYMWAHMKKGSITQPLFQSLDAFWPGMQSLLGEIDKGMKTLHNYHQIWRQFGATPEFYNIPKAEAHQGREGYPLRPELIESTMYLYYATKDPYLLGVGVDILEAIDSIARTDCGYATVKDVLDHRLENRMESFFLAETTKYLYLLFDEDNFIHNTGDHGQLLNTPNGECIIETGFYIFNTEAHPIDGAAVHCCSAEKKEEDRILQEFHDNIDLLALLGLSEPNKDLFGSDLNKKKWRKSRKNKTVNELSVTIDGSQPKGPVVPSEMEMSQTPSAATAGTAETDEASQPAAQVRAQLTDFSNIDEAVSWMLENIQLLGGKLTASISEKAADSSQRDSENDKVESIRNNLKDSLKNMQDEVLLGKKSDDKKSNDETSDGDLSIEIIEDDDGDQKAVIESKEFLAIIDPKDVTTRQVNEESQVSSRIDPTEIEHSAEKSANIKAEVIVDFGVADTIVNEDFDEKLVGNRPKTSMNLHLPTVQNIDSSQKVKQTERCVDSEKQKEEIEEEEVCKFDSDGVRNPGLDSQAGQDTEEFLYEDEASERERLFTCPAQPFYSRMSVMGEMFNE